MIWRALLVVILAAAVFSLLVGCQAQPAARSVPVNIPTAIIATPTISMPSPQPVVTFTTIVEPTLPARQPQQPTKTPAAAENRSPVDCHAVYCLIPADYLLVPPVRLAGQTFIDPTYPFGSTQNGEREVHLGVEFQQAHGAPVLAAASGRVLVAGDDSQSAYGVWNNIYGKLVVIEHELSGWDVPVYTLYAHLSDVRVSTGNLVEAGEIVGLVGASGAATGSHLHFEVRLGSNEPAAAVNPLLFLFPAAESEAASGQIVGLVADEDNTLVHEIDLVLQPLEVEPEIQNHNRYLQTYASGVLANSAWGENFVSGPLPSGHYRLTLVHAGRFYERILPVEPGSVTYLKIQLGE